jgi:hypothetical protein
LFAVHLILVLAKPPHSPDLSPPTLFPFPKIKMTLKGRFQMVEDIITNMKDELRVIKKHLLNSVPKVKKAMGVVHFCSRKLFWSR